MSDRLFYIILLLSISIPFWAQRPNYQTFENIHLSAEASVVSFSTQDSQGVMWIGSDKGLYSYDGYTTQQHYTFGEKNSTRIYCGITVEDQYLYFGGDNGLLIYNYQADCYEELQVSFPGDIRALALQENDLWIGTLNGLYVYNMLSGDLRRINREENKGLPHETIYSLVLSADGRLYIGTYNGLCFYEKNEDKFQEIALPAHLYKSNQFVNVLLEDTLRNCIWIGTEGELFKYNPSNGDITCIDIFHDNSVKSLALDQYQNLLAGTDNGLFVYHEDFSLLHVTHDSRNSHSLSNNIIWHIFTDREKNIWLATDFGISLSRFTNDFQYIPIYQITGTGEGNHFYSLFKDSRKNYWFGGSNGIIRVQGLTEDKRSTDWYKMGSNNLPLSHNRIRHIYEDKDKHLWVATDGGVNRFDYQARQFVHYNIVDSTGVYNCNWAYHILEDDEGQLWIATCLGGIFVVDKEKLLNSKGGNYKADYNINTGNGLSGMFISQIVPDGQGDIWALLYNNAGINRIDPDSKQVTRIPTEELTGERNFNYIISDRSGVIWIGYRNGIVRFIPGQEEVELVRLDDFSNNEILSMAEVNDALWISRTDGVWVLNKQSLESQRLKMANKVFTSLYYDTENDQVYMGAIDGFAVTSPEILLADNPKRPILFTGLYINNQPVVYDKQISNRSIRYSDGLVLTYRQNNISLDVSDLPYSGEEKSNFVYRLSGVDNEWNILKPNTNRITFNNLSHGIYQLTVSRLEANGKPSDEKFTLDIRINPPWYLTIWAKSLYVILFLVLIVWTINFFRVKHRLKNERKEKEKLIEQSQAKIDFFTEMSNDLTSPLSLIIGPVSKLLLELKDPAEKKQLEEVWHHAMQINSLVHNRLEEEIQAKSRLEQMTTPKETEIVSTDEKFLADITHIIEGRLSDPDLNVNALCDASGINNKQLYRKIKQLTGVTPVDYIKTIRMKNAAMLLRQKKSTVAEVMYKVGYSNHSYFSKCFQAEYGKTPRQYMEDLE